MQNLFESPKPKKESENPEKLENLSPDKYGKAAYVELTYTPSKLADNVIYRDASSLRKMEEGTNRNRELEALNSLLEDRLNQLR